MHYRTGFFLLLPALIAVLGTAPNADAVIKVDLPVSKRFATARTVVIGKVSAIDPEKKLVVVTTEQRLKDDAAPQTFRIQFATAESLMKSVAVGQPVVLLAKLRASIHIADTWLIADPAPNANPPLWRIAQVENSAAGKTFPGSTASLVRAMQELKSGKSTLLDDFQEKVFTGGVKELARLDVAKPTFMLSLDVNGDGKADLVVATPSGVKLFLASADGYADATEAWSLKGVAASVAAGGDVNGDGKPDLLLDGALYLNDGRKFSPAPQAVKLDADAHVLASTLADLTGGGKADAGLLLTDGRLLVFKNPGQSTLAWARAVDRKLTPGGEPPQAGVFGNFASSGSMGVMVILEKAVTLYPIKEDEPPTDFFRLTGDAITQVKGFAAGLKNAVPTRLDLNGDRRLDLLLTADGASMILVNRGFGAFLPDTDAGEELTTAVSKVPSAPLSAIRARAAVSRGTGRDDLLLLTDDGHLLLADNPTVAK